MTGAEREQLAGMILERFRAGDTVVQIAGELGIADAERICKKEPIITGRQQGERIAEIARRIETGENKVKLSNQHNMAWAAVARIGLQAKRGKTA